MSFWDTIGPPWQAALEEAWTAYLHGSLPIGACIARGDAVIARGRNRIAETHQAIGTHSSGTQISHAELNALLQLPADLETRDLVLYTTMEPCPMCAGAITMASFKTIHFAARDPWAGCARLFKDDSYVSSKRVVVHPPHSRLLEAINVTLLMHSDYEWRGEVDNAFTRQFRQTHPVVVELARGLWHAGTIRTWREQRVSAREVVNATARELEVIA